MLTKRIVVCLDVHNGRVVKGTGFRQLRDVGDPVALAAGYEDAGADEIVFLDVSATAEARATLLEDVRRTSESLYVPLTVGGGIRSAEDVARVLRAGADKVSINSAAVARPALLTDCAGRFGSQCIVASIDARCMPLPNDAAAAPAARAPGRSWTVFTHGGRRRTVLDVLQWARRCEELGAGEILLTSIDRDGARGGYDLALTRAVSAAVGIPVVASGGAGTASHVVEVLCEGGADAALVAGILHDGLTTVSAIKDELARRGLPVRLAS